MVNSRPSATTTEEKPPDRSALQSCFGPPLGHSWSKPASREIPSRCGPRQHGQSSAFADPAKDAASRVIANATTPILELTSWNAMSCSHVGLERKALVKYRLESFG